MRVFINTEFEGIHNYPEAPEEVAFLRNDHRHMFKVYVEITVTHDDRDLEFILLKRFVNEQLKERDLDYKSCEMIANEILKSVKEKYGPLREYKVIVSEDGENGAIVDWRNYK